MKINLLKNLNKIISFGLIVFLLFKVSSTPITYDEAFTYLSYVRTNDYLTVNIANNHLLNTILMGIFSFFGNSEFILRLPNLISGIIYIYVGFKISTKFENNLLILLIVLLNPVVFDFLSLARGYGISATLNLVGIYIFLFSDIKQKYFFSICLFWLSSLAIYTNLITLLSFVILNLFFEKKSFLSIKNFIINLSFTLLSIPIALKLFEITQESKPLFGRGVEIGNVERIFTIFGFLKTYFLSSSLLNIVFFLLIMAILKNIDKSYSSIFSIMLFLLVLLFLILVPLLFSKPFPVERLLIPFVPFFQLTLCFLFKDIKNKLFTNLISLLLVINFLINIDLNTSLYWEDFIDTNKISNSAYCESLDSSRPEYIYYTESRGYC